MSKDYRFDQGEGYRIYRNVIDEEKAKEIFMYSTLEICFYVFGQEATKLINNLSMKVTQIICDPNLRKELAIPDDVVRRNGNPRESKVLKKSGKTSLYLSPYIRDHIRRNVDVYNIFKEMYTTEKLAFSAGLDHIIYKPNMSEESLPILDCTIFEPLNHSTSIKNPFHYTCFMGMSSKTGKDSGMISLLINFDRYFDIIKTLIKLDGKFPISKQKKGITVSLLENLNIENINKELKEMIEFRGEIFYPLYWKQVDVMPGDMLLFDCRIPYKTDRNRSEDPIMYVPISLRPIDQSWYSSESRRRLIRSITEGKAGNWSKRTTKGCNLDEFRWRSNEENLLNSKMTSCIGIDNFTEKDLKIFGIKQY